MGTLKDLKTKMRHDRNFRRTLLRSAKDEILIDLDGDREADIALLDTMGNGDIDFLAVDLTGDGEFDLYIGDTDANGTPDILIYDTAGGGELRVLRAGEAPEHALITAASLVRSAVVTGDYIPDTLEEKMAELERQIMRAKQEKREKQVLKIKRRESML